MKATAMAVVCWALLGTMACAQACVFVSPPTSYLGIIYDREIVPLVKQYYPNAFVVVADEIYAAIPFAEMLRFLREDENITIGQGIAQHQGDYLDSDDFALALAGSASKMYGWSAIALGIVGGGPCGFVPNEEAVFFNIFITRDAGGRLVIFEINPMTDVILPAIPRANIRFVFL